MTMWCSSRDWLALAEAYAARGQWDRGCGDRL